MLNPFSKTSWIEHVLEGYVGAMLRHTSLSQPTQAWVVSVARAFVFAALAGGFIAYSNGKILWTPTLAAFVLLLIRTVQQSPMPREVWTDAQRLAYEEMLAAQKRLESAATVPPAPPGPGPKVLIVAALLAASPLYAADDLFPAPGEDLNGAPVVMETLGGVIGTAGAGLDIKSNPYFRLGVDYPIPVAGTCKNCIVPVRGYTNVGVTTGQGSTADFQSIAAFKSWEFTLGIYRVLGAADFGTTQRITFALCGEFGAKALFNVPADQPLSKSDFRHYGAGVGVGETRSGALIRGLYSHNEENGPGWGAGDLMIYGQVPLIGKDGPFTLLAGVSLPLAPPSSSSIGHERRAIYSFAATVNINAVVSAFQRPK